MPKFYHHYVQLIFLFLCSTISAQTTLYPGDIALMAIAADMALCGQPPQSDEISFVCFQDITTGTTIDITDNGWESVYPGFWGDGEGTLRMSRTGGTIPKGTVITLQAQNNAGGWFYRTISPDNGWAITNVNIPGGPFNIETGGDQVYFMQGGTWNNQGGGTNKAIYDGMVLFGYNTLDTWAANGTTQQSNLHPDVIPCYYMQSSPGEPYIDFQKFADLPFSPLGHVRWLNLILDPSYWYTFQYCTEFNAADPSYSTGYSIEIDDDMSISCLVCQGCQGPFDDGLEFHLPPGTYNVVYTDGTNTYELMGIMDGHQIFFTVNEDVSYWLVSVEEVGGCMIYSPFPDPITIDNIGRNPGLYNELWLCPNWAGTLNLFNFLNGNPEPGGIWLPEGGNGSGVNPNGGIITYHNGPGLYTYYLPHPKPPFPPPFPTFICVPPYDSASVRIHFIDPSLTTIEIGCGQNGTPNDIFDDQIVFTLTFNADTFGVDYSVQVSSGTITPSTGLTGVPTVFTLSPGSAIGPDLEITVIGNLPFACAFDFPIPAPGFCSDPCDYDMTASLSGSEDICLKNCPDNPAFLNVDVSGGTEPFKMDFSLFAPNHPVWNFPGIPIDPFTEIEICIDNVPAPIFNATTGFLTLPQFLAGSELTFTLLQVSDKYDCTGFLDNDEHTIIIHALPALATTSFSVCKEFAKTVDLTEYEEIINPFLDITWYDGNPFLAGEEINFPTSVNLENVVALWVYAKDDYCENVIQVNFTILPSPKLDTIEPVQICSGSPVILQSIPVVDPGSSDAIYTYHPGLPFDSTNLINPAFFLPADSTTVYLLATAGICFDTLPIEINVLDYPDFSLLGEPCDLIMDTYSILFTSSAESIISSAGTVINHPAGQDSIVGISNDLNVSIELLSPLSLCRDTFLIVAPNCNCPLIPQPVAPQTNFDICEGTPLPLLSMLNSPGLITNWYDVPSGGVPILQNSLVFQPTNPINASYYVEAFDPANGCFSIRTQITLQINPVADLQVLADPDLCETENINFSSLVPSVLNGVGGNGQWYDLTTHLPVSGVIQPQNGNTWYYLFTSVPGSCLSSDTIVATVNPLPTIDLFDILCIDAQLIYEVSFTSDADIVLASTGNLTQIAGTDSFLLSDIPFDTDIQFDLQNTSTGCSASIFQAAPDCSCPPLLQNNIFQLCSDQGVVDLSTFEGFGVTGNWQLVSTPPGSNPATLNGSNFQGQNSDPGLYVLRFIRSVILADCVDTASFQLQLNKAPFADAGSNAVVCAPDPILLTGNADGDNVVFNWLENGTGVIGNPNALNITYTPTLADISAGSVSFTLTANDQTGFCPSASETITITIDGSAYFILNAGSQIYCDTSDIQVDFDDLISFGNTGGEWFFPDTVSAPIVGSSIFNPSTLAAGNYTVFYTSTNAVFPCKNDTVAVNLIIENCSCPSVALSIPGQGICSDSGLQDLNDFLLTTESGNWSIVGTPPGSKPAVLNGTKFVTNNSDDGIYRLRFTLNNPIAGCDDFSEITLEVIDIPSLQIASIDCADDLQSWESVVITSAGNLTNTQGNLTSLGNDRYLIDGLTLNTTVQVSASNGNGLCTSNITIPAPDCECTLSISNLPDIVLLCPNEIVTFDAAVTGGKGDVTEFWIVANDSLYQNTLEVGTAGIYQFVSFDELGCRQEKLIYVSIYTEMVPDASVIDITCPGDQDGQIIIHYILGGNGPFFISINGGNMQPISSFPYNIGGLSTGNYKIELLDEFSCSVSFDLTVASVSAETLDLGPDKTILVGDSVLINPLLSFNPDSFYWTGDLTLINSLALDNWIKPDIDQSFMLFAIDSKGCLYSDDLNIRVLLHSDIYIPTVFSPNGDGVNDLLTPLADPSVTTIEYFEIFSRWGELVYSKTGFTPNQTNEGWDGTLRGKKLMPGVFVYRISAVNKKGKLIQQTGDITLLK